MKQITCAILASVLLTSCATTTEYAKQAYEYGRNAGSWVGQKIEALYSSEGKPDAVETQADGGKVVEYQRPLKVTAPPAPPALQTSGPSNATTAATSIAPATTPETAPATRVVPCTTRYKVDREGTIRSWTIDGAGCKAIEIEAKSQP